MCGRFLLISSPDVLAAYFAVASLAKLRPYYNIAPSQLVAAVGLDRQGRRDLAMFRWGFVPHWAQDPKKAVINARSPPTGGVRAGRGIWLRPAPSSAKFPCGRLLPFFAEAGRQHYETGVFPKDLCRPCEKPVASRSDRLPSGACPRREVAWCFNSMASPKPTGPSRRSTTSP
jgi:hypothetical protein